VTAINTTCTSQISLRRLFNNNITKPRCPVIGLSQRRELLYFIFVGYEYTKPSPSPPSAKLQPSSTTAISRFSSLFASSYHGSPGLRPPAAISSCAPRCSKHKQFWGLVAPHYGGKLGGPIRGSLLSREHRICSRTPSSTRSLLLSM
jgi:hypothetical protein